MGVADNINWNTDWEGKNQHDPKKIDNLKILVMGATNVGKTSMIMTYVNGEFPAEYIPTVTGITYGHVQNSDTKMNIFVYDTAGRGDYFEIRRQMFPDTDVVVLCYSSIDEPSLEVIGTEYKMELDQFMPSVPVVLVGTKIDLRDDPDTLEKLKERRRTVITEKEGKEVARQFKFNAFCECSALKKTGLKVVFDHAVRLALNPPEKRKKEKCVLM